MCRDRNLWSHHYLWQDQSTWTVAASKACCPWSPWTTNRAGWPYTLGARRPGRALISLSAAVERGTNPEVRLPGCAPQRWSVSTWTNFEASRLRKKTSQQGQQDLFAPWKWKWKCRQQIGVRFFGNHWLCFGCFFLSNYSFLRKRTCRTLKQFWHGHPIFHSAMPRISSHRVLATWKELPWCHGAFLHHGLWPRGTAVTPWPRARLRQVHCDQSPRVLCLGAKWHPQWQKFIEFPCALLDHSPRDTLFSDQPYMWRQISTSCFGETWYWLGFDPYKVRPPIER